MGEFIALDTFWFLVFCACIAALLWAFGWHHKIKSMLTKKKKGGEKHGQKNN